MLFKGDIVRVKTGISIPDLEAFDLSGWQGKVIAFVESEETKGEYNIEVKWDEVTLKNMPQAYIQLNIDEDYDVETFIFDKEDIERIKQVDTKLEEKLKALNIVQANPSSIDNVEKFIKKVIESNDLKVTSIKIKTFLEFIKNELAMPCILAGIESMGDFGWEERFQFGYGSKAEHREMRKKYPSLDDEFEIIEFLENKIEQYLTIPVKVKRLSDNKIFSLKLDELKPVDDNSKNYAIIDSFVTWIVNY